MQFHVDQDTGSVIRGWIIHDNPSIIPTIRIRFDQGEEHVLDANEQRTDMRDLGRHTTGQCGFSIGVEQVGESIFKQDLEIFDDQSGMLIYRRFHPERHIAEKLFFFEPSGLSIHRLFLSLAQNFAIGYEHTHNFSFELMYSLLSGKYTNSMLLFGHATLARYQLIAASEGFKSVALLRNPMHELAERLLCALHLANNRDRNALVLAAPLHDLAPLVAGVNLNDDRSLNALVRQLRVDRIPAVSNPMTRSIACMPGEPVERRHVGVALDLLARMDLVGMREHFGEFHTLFLGLFGLHFPSAIAPEQYALVDNLAARLSNITAALDLVEHDLAIYEFVTDSIEGKV